MHNSPSDPYIAAWIDAHPRPRRLCTATGYITITNVRTGWCRVYFGAIRGIQAFGERVYPVLTGAAQRPHQQV